MAGSRLARVGSRRRGQARDYREKAEGDELVTRDKPFSGLYRCVWVEEGEIKYSRQSALVYVEGAMRKLLAKGLPAWVEHVPWEDDDVPF